MEPGDELNELIKSQVSQLDIWYKKLASLEKRKEQLTEPSPQGGPRTSLTTAIEKGGFAKFTGGWLNVFVGDSNESHQSINQSLFQYQTT